MNQNHIKAIFLKQLKDTFRNKTILIQFLLFPIMALIMESSMNSSDLPERYFVQLFAIMYVGMAPLCSMAAVLAEEKEKNTLRVLLLSNVKPREYLLGVGSYIWLACMLGTVALAWVGEYSGKELVLFLLLMGFGHMVSILFGGIIGILSKSQMAATSITIPFMMILAFLPMISMFNDKVKLYSQFLYTQQMNNIISNISETVVLPSNLGFILLNAIIVFFVFLLVYHKYGLEQ